MGWLPGSGCVLWHQMDEREGERVYDLSGFENHGARYGAIWKRGKIGFALSFDGVDDYVEVPDSPSLDITGEVTVEARIFPRKLDVFGGGISKGDTQIFRDTNYYLEIAYGGFRWGGGDGTNEVIVRSNPKATNQWYHVIGVMKDNQWPELYVNTIYDVAVREGTPIILTPNNLILVIGRAAAYYSDSIIDEVRIYNRALSVKEIKARYWYGIIPSLRVPPVAVR